MFSEDHHPLRVPQTCHIQAYSGKIFAMAPTPAFYIYSYTYEYMFTVLLYIHMWFGLCLGQGLGIVLLSWSLQQSTLPAYVNQGNSRYLMSHTLPCVLCPDSQPGVPASQRTSCTHFFYTCIYIDIWGYILIIILNKVWPVPIRGTNGECAWMRTVHPACFREARQKLPQDLTHGTLYVNACLPNFVFPCFGTAAPRLSSRPTAQCLELLPSRRDNGAYTAEPR